MVRQFIFFAILSILCLCFLNPVHAQTGPLTQQQVEALIAAHTPDAVISGEIAKRGIIFSPDIPKLKTMGAGPKTLTALAPAPKPVSKPNRPSKPSAPAPVSLDDAKAAIPDILKPLYAALSEGNSSAAAAFMSPQLAADAAKLDKICKPFSYKAHYVESVIERPSKIYEARTRVLMEPMEEDAYVLIFERQGERFVLTDVRQPDETWFSPLLTATSDLARKFFYAARLKKVDLLPQFISAGVSTAAVYDPDVRYCLESPDNLDLGEVKVVEYKGLKGEVEGNVHVSCYSVKFLIDRVGSNFKIVSWNVHRGLGCSAPQKDWGGIDPNMESYTLQRFGLTTASVPSSAMTGDATLDYDSYIKLGVDALRTGEFDKAYIALQTATNANPARPEAWALLGNACIGVQKFSDTIAAWDKSIAADGTLNLEVVHEKNFDSEMGTFSMNGKEVSFSVAGKKVFAVPPAGVLNMETGNGKGRLMMTNEEERRLGTWIYFRLKAAGKNYNFDFIPLGVQCEPRDWYLNCPSEGIAQQRIVAQYVVETITRLAKSNK